MNSPMMMINQNDLIETIIEPLEHAKVEWRDNDKEVYMNWTWEQMTLTSQWNLISLPPNLFQITEIKLGTARFPNK